MASYMEAKKPVGQSYEIQLVFLFPFIAYGSSLHDLSTKMSWLPKFY